MFRHLALIAFAALSCNVALSQKLHGKLVPPPAVCEPGYEKGVSAQFYGLEQGKVIVAGGANFPDEPAAKGGKKVFYKGIYQLESDQWKQIGQNTTVLNYEAYLDIDSCNILTTNALRKTYDSAIIDKIKLTSRCDLPNKLIQPIVVADSCFVYVWGGFTLNAGVPIGGWKVCTASGNVEKIAAPLTENLTGAALVPYKEGFLVVGGVNRKIFESALNRREQMKTAPDAELERLKIEDRDYMMMSPRKYKFNDRLLLYNPATNKWTTLGRSEHLARAGAAAIIDNNERLIVTGGELKPGIRNPMTWIFDLKTLP